MSQTLDLKKAEKQVFRLATFEDGIWEIYLGLIFTLMSFFPLTRELLGPALNAVLFLGISLLLAAMAVIAQKRITQPRIGLVKLGSQTKKTIKTAHIITIGIVLLTFAVIILRANSLLDAPTWERLPQWFIDFDIDLVFALIMVGIFSLVAFSTGIPRFYLHGVLLGVGNFAATVLLVYYEVLLGWPVALAGLMIAAVGIIVLIQFSQAYPLPTEDEADG